MSIRNNNEKPYILEKPNMKKTVRQIVVISIGIGILGLGILVKSFLSQKKKGRSKNTLQETPIVFAKKTLNGVIPIHISGNGRVSAKYKIQLTSEVTGILESPNFKEGIHYDSASTIVTIGSDSYEASIVAQRSDFYAQLLKLLPSLKTDYPKVWKKWAAYLKTLDVEKTTPELPKFQSKREKNFIISNGILMTYQNIKNMELQKEKYQIKAPFDGTLSKTLIQHGELISSGQSIGTFQSTGAYELLLQLPKNYLRFLELGNQVSLTNLDKSKDYFGTVTRINPSIESTTQTATVYIEIKSNDLKEGDYLTADVEAAPVQNAIRIDRSLIDEKGCIYYIKEDLTLGRLKITPVYFDTYTVIVKDVPNNISILTRTLPTAYEGMKVKPTYEETNHQMNLL